MKNIILLLILLIFNFCTAQKRIRSINDANVIENIVFQFTQKAKIKFEDSVFVLYFQEKPQIVEVLDNMENKQTYKGSTITIYRFENENQISEFVNSFNVYQKSKNIFYIFDKKSNPRFLRKLKKNPLYISKFNYNSDIGYDPQSWVLNFNIKNQLEECYPYDCN